MVDTARKNTPARPINPYLVLVAAIVFPGAGHVVIGQPARGLIYIFFIILFGLLTFATTAPEQSFIARHAGGLFIWALSIPDAYRRARILAIAPRQAQSMPAE